MRGLLTALLLVLAFAVSWPAGATVIDVVVRDIGYSGGRLGVASDPLEVGDRVGIDFVLDHNPHPEFPSEDGYLLESMDLDLVVTGPASLHGLMMCKCGYVALTWNGGFDTFHPKGQPHAGDELNWYELDDNAYEGFTAASLSGVQGPAILLQGLGVRADAPGMVEVDLSLGGSTQYSPYGGWPGAGNPWDWIAATNADLGDLTLHVIPEPGTLLLLVFGLLPLCRRSPS
jgi:hypothetical protein